MKIVTWNMGRRDQEAGWAYLLNELNPDIALLQEVQPPERFQKSNLLYAPIGGSRNWGSAVYTSHFPVREVIIERYKGWVAAGAIQLQEGCSIVAVSIHAQIMKKHIFPNLTSLFNDISPFLREEMFIVGGDLNAGRWFDKVQGTKYHNAFFDRIESGGFFNCHRKFHAEEQQTFWGVRTKYPYQIDHLFVSEDLRDRIMSCHVCDNERVRKLSDHSLLVAEVCI